MKTIERLEENTYLGDFTQISMGYSLNENHRKMAASGGLVTEYLLYLLNNNYIEGAIVSKSSVIDGKLESESYIATNVDEVLAARTSVYIDTPVINVVNQLKNYDGKVAVVGLPCQLKAIDLIIEKNPELRDKIVKKIGLYCCGVCKKDMFYSIFDNNHIDLNTVKKFIFKYGHWRGNSKVIFKDDSSTEFSYNYNQSVYKNAYFDTLKRCFSCQDHFAYHADVSFGDVWLPEMKKNPIKHSSVLIRNKDVVKDFEKMLKDNLVFITNLSVDNLIESQKRPLIFKFHTASARKMLGKFFGFDYDNDILVGSKWNHFLVSILILMNMKISTIKPIRNFVYHIPTKILFIYMGFIRFLLSF